jgi:hypothetical protein
LAISIFGASLGIAALYPILMLGPYETYLAYKTVSLNKTLTEYGTQKTAYSSKIAAIEDSIRQNNTILNALDSNYGSSVTVLQDLAAIKTNYTLKIMILIDISNAIASSKTRLEMLDINDTNATLICVANDSANLAQLSRQLANLYKEPPVTPKLVNENGIYKTKIQLSNIGEMPNE